MELAESHTVERSTSRSTTLLLGGLVLFGFLLRFWRLGNWSFESDEVFMLRDSLHPTIRNPRPLLYFLNHYVVAPFVPLNEFGLRLLPALFGVLAIPGFYAVSRRLVGTRSALFATFLLTVSPLLVIFSQFARYWSLVFLLCAVYPYALYLGVKERDRGMLILGLVTLVLACLAHPASVLLIGGPGIWLMFTYLRPRYLRRAWDQKVVRWGMIAALVVAIVIAVRFVPILLRWVAVHDTMGPFGQYLLGPKLAPGLKQLKYLLAYAEGLTLPVAVTGAVGVYILAKRGNRTLAIYLASVALFPIIFLTLVSLRTPVSIYYLLPTTPVFFIGAGVFLSRMFEVDWGLRARWLVPATVLLVILDAGTPTLISQYRNGRRYDFRAAARWLEQRLTPSDVVFSDQPVAMGYYLPKRDVQQLRFNTELLQDSLQAIHRDGQQGTLWIIAPAPAHAFRTNLKQGGLAAWMYGNCQLRNSLGAGRLDFRQQYLQIYQCPPETPHSTQTPSSSRGERSAR
jgi:mannosyltransferase